MKSKCITRRQCLDGLTAVLGLGAADMAGCARTRRAAAANSITVLYGSDDLLLGPDGAQARYMVFVPLVAWNAKGELEGRLAESWEHSLDYRTWTIRLRDGIRWHDGVPVTAHDIKFSLDLLSHPDVLGFAPDLLTVKVIDRLTYSLTCNHEIFWGTPKDDETVYYPRYLLEKMEP